MECRVQMSRLLRAFSLVALLAATLVTTASLPTGDPLLFEAAFQGRCGEGSPCEQLCRELHDGTYECGCGPGFVLHVDGYGCLELNSSKPIDPTSDTKEDVLYQKEVSFSAELEIALPSNRINKFTKKQTKKPVHIEELTTQPNDISMDADEDNISILGQKYKKIDGLNSLISEGVSRNDINMIADYNEERFEDSYKNDEGLKTTTLGPSLEQKVPGATSSPPWTAAVDNCQCGNCAGSKKCSQDSQISTPRFTGTSWLALRALRGAYKRVRIRLRLRPERAKGVILLTGEHDDLSGDYLALVLHQGHVELRFDCGSGAGILRSPEPVRLGSWNTISVYRHRWDAWLKLNDGKKIRGRSKGLFSRMTFREPVWIGGGGNTTGLMNKLDLSDGFLGCVDYLRINSMTYHLTRDAVATADITECAPKLAPWKSPFGPTLEIPISNHINDVEHSVYDINDIVHFEDNDIVMRDSRTDSHIDIDNSIEQFKVVKKFDKMEDRCACQHGGGCVSGICLCPLGYAGVRCEITLDLKVPRFNGSSYLRLPGLGNSAISWLDIQITLKPSSGTGLVLYNADKVSGDGDFFSLHLREYFVEFAFDLGSGIALVRSAYPLQPNQWHRISINRSGHRATLRVRSQDPTVLQDTTRSVTSRGVARKLNLRQPLLLGGAPRPLPPRLALTDSYSGCVSQLVINDEEISVVSSALGGVNVDNCEEPANNTCSAGFNLISQRAAAPRDARLRPQHVVESQEGVITVDVTLHKNNEECQQTYEIIPDYQLKNDSISSVHHTIVAKKGIKPKHKSKKHYTHQKKSRNDLIKIENDVIVDKSAGKLKKKYLNANEINWVDTNTYPSFIGIDSFIHMDDEETMKRLLSYTLDINIRFRCVGPHGLLVWSGRMSPKPGDDFLSLGIENSVLVFRYDLGSGEVVIIANHTKVDDGLWHRARATRNRQAGVLEVDGLGSVGKISPGNLKQLNTENGLYIGGLPSIEMNTMGKYRSGLVGCVSQISLSGDFDIPLSLSKLPHTITNNVGRCTP